MRRKDREQTKEFALNVADSCDYAVMSMVDPEGKPYCVPLSIARDEEKLYFHCALEGFKTDCLRNSNDVCVSCVGKTKNIPEEFTTEYVPTTVFFDSEGNLLNSEPLIGAKSYDEW